MSDSIGIVILAAGKGTRMKIDTPKALVRTAGKALLDYVIKATKIFANEVNLDHEIAIVVGHKKEMIEEWLETSQYKSSCRSAWQKEQRGTADAVRACFEELPEFWNHEYTLIACADTPLIEAKEFHELFSALKSDQELVGVAATFEISDPKGYGRIIKGKKGFHIVEEKDASIEEKKIAEVNSGFYILKTTHLKEVLFTISNKNKSQEFYLTDLFQDEYKVKAVKFPSETPFLGINTMAQLAMVTNILVQRKIHELMISGVEFLNPNSVYVDQEVSIGTGSVIYPQVTLLGSTSLGEKVIVESGAFVKDSWIDHHVHILAYSYLEGARVEESASIGPFARLRHDSEIGAQSKVGNFVEIKKSKLSKGVKVSHLSYVGDAEIGEETNIGCGFITCNYDGAQKHKTKIGRNTFIGSDCQTIAPVEIGNDAFVAAGSTVTTSIPDGGFGIARARLEVKEGAAKRFLKKKKS